MTVPDHVEIKELQFRFCIIVERFFGETIETERSLIKMHPGFIAALLGSFCP